MKFIFGFSLSGVRLTCGATGSVIVTRAGMERIVELGWKLIVVMEGIMIKVRLGAFSL